MKPTSAARSYIPSEMLFLSIALLCAIFCAWSFLYSKDKAAAARTPSSELLANPPAPSRALVASENNTVSELTLTCLEAANGKSFKTHASMISLSSLCKSEASATGVTGANQRNSYGIQFMATPKDKRWISNYFQLEPGKNQIDLTLAYRGKTRAFSLDVIRD